MERRACSIAFNTTALFLKVLVRMSRHWVGVLLKCLWMANASNRHPEGASCPAATCTHAETTKETSNKSMTQLVRASLPFASAPASLWGRFRVAGCIFQAACKMDEQRNIVQTKRHKTHCRIFRRVEKLCLTKRDARSDPVVPVIFACTVSASKEHRRKENLTV